MKVIVYIPGIGHGYFTKNSLDSYAYRYMKAIDLSEDNAKKRYSLSYSKMKYGKKEEYLSDVATIIEINENNEEKEVCRVFQMDYADSITKAYEGKNIIAKMFFILIFFTVNIPKFISSIFRDKKKNTLTKNLQLTYTAIIFFIVSMGGVLLIPSIIPLINDAMISIVSLINEFFSNTTPIDKQPPNILEEFTETSLYQVLKYISNFVLSGIAIIAVFSPGFQRFITEFSNRILGLENYLRLGEEKLNIIGKLETLVEKISEEEEYDTMEIHGYSLGSIILLDTIFPYGNEPALRISQNVETIVTIGCLYDFVKTFFPAYFKERQNHKINLLNWYNVYSRPDIISSNFNKDFHAQNASHGIVDQGLKPQNIRFEVVNLKTLKFFDYIMLIGLKAHDMYWGSEPDSKSCLRTLIMEQKERNLMH